MFQKTSVGEVRMYALLRDGKLLLQRWKWKRHNFFKGTYMKFPSFSSDIIFTNHQMLGKQKCH